MLHILKIKKLFQHTLYIEIASDELTLYRWIFKNHYKSIKITYTCATSLDIVYSQTRTNYIKNVFSFLINSLCKKKDKNLCKDLLYSI